MYREANSRVLQPTMQLALWRMRAAREASESNHQWCTALFPRDIAALWRTANLRCHGVPFLRTFVVIFHSCDRNICHGHSKLYCFAFRDSCTVNDFKIILIFIKFPKRLSINMEYIIITKRFISIFFKFHIICEFKKENKNKMRNK